MLYGRGPINGYHYISVSVHLSVIECLKCGVFMRLKLSSVVFIVGYNIWGKFLGCTLVPKSLRSLSLINLSGYFPNNSFFYVGKFNNLVHYLLMLFGSILSVLLSSAVAELIAIIPV